MFSVCSVAIFESANNGIHRKHGTKRNKNSTFSKIKHDYSDEGLTNDQPTNIHEHLGLERTSIQWEDEYPEHISGLRRKDDPR